MAKIKHSTHVANHHTPDRQSISNRTYNARRKLAESQERLTGWQDEYEFITHSGIYLQKTNP